MSPEPAPRGLRQTMSDLHIWAGLLVGWVLYAMFLTGSVSYFKEEISQWMRPEVPQASERPDPALVAQSVVDTLQTLAPNSPQWGVTLPTVRDNTASAFWRTGSSGGRRSFESAHFDPTTGLKVAGRETLGGDFFYRFHFQFHYMPAWWGRWIAGFCAMAMLVAIVSGVITHKKIFVDFFTFRWGKGQRSWLDAHNAFSVLGLPFHAMITYTGLVTLMTLYMPFGEQAAFRSPAERQAMSRELNAFIQPGRPSGQAMALAPVQDMVRQAQARWGDTQVRGVVVTLNGDAAARVAVTRGEAGRGSVSPQYLLFDGGTGALLEAREQVGPAAETRGVMVALHMGRFSDPLTRWLYFIVSLAGTAMVGTGLVMWTVKRRGRLACPDRPHIGFWVVERLNIATMAGLSIAMTTYLWGNRLLPLELAERAQWEAHLFFAAWALSLLHAMLRPARCAWVEQLGLATALLAALPLWGMLATDRPLWKSLAEGDWVFSGIELMLWVFAALHATLTIRCARQGRPSLTQRPTNRAPHTAGTPRVREAS